MKKLRKGKYKVINWSEYNQSLKDRGDITFWISDDAIQNWEIENRSIKTRGRQYQYSKVAIETMYVLRQLFNLRLRQTEGLTRSILKIMNLNLAVPDYTTVSRRIRNLTEVYPN